MNTIHFFIIKKSILGANNPQFLNTAFFYKEVAEEFCKNNNEDFISFSPIHVKGESIDGYTVIYNSTVFKLDSTTYKECLINRIKNKLTKEEIQLLGI